MRERIEDPVNPRKIEADDSVNRAATTTLSRRTIACADLDQDCPWHGIAAERKWFSRVAAIEAAVAVPRDGPELGPLPVDKGVENTAGRLPGNKVLAELNFAVRKTK